MQRIYRLQHNPHYQALALADPALLTTSAWHFDSTSKASIWEPAELVCLDNQKPEPDFWWIERIPTVFVCDERVLNDVPVLWEEGICEPLPVRCSGRTLWLCNVTENGCWDALDVERCVWSSGTPSVGLPSQYTFLSDRLIFTTVLTVPETCELELYVSADYDDPIYEFKAKVEEEGLTGLVFEEIWHED